MRTYFQVPPVLAKPFAHCRYADSGSYVSGMFSGAGVIRQTLTTIFNLQDKLSFLFVQTDGCGIAAGVAPDVCQSFLNHAEQIHLQFRPQATDLFLYVQSNFDTGALYKTSDIPFHRAHEPELIESGRMQ